jgi:hypothetical protein
MSKDKLCGVLFLFVCGMVISGCLGYSIKEKEHLDRMEIIARYNAQQSSCSEMMNRLGTLANKSHYKKLSPKEMAIARMERN